MGNYPEDRAGPGELPTRGCAPDHRKTTTEKGGQALEISSSEGGHEIGRFRGDLEVHHKETEYGRAIHCDATDSGTL